MQGAAGRCHAAPGDPDMTQKIMQSSLTPIVLAAARQIGVSLVVAFHHIGVVSRCGDSLVNLVNTGLCRVEHDGELVRVHVPAGALYAGHAFGCRLNRSFAHSAVAPNLELGSLGVCGRSCDFFYRRGPGSGLLSVCVMG